MDLMLICKAWCCQEVHVGRLFELLNSSWSEKGGWLQEEVAVIEGQVAELKGLVQQQDALNAGLQQRVQTASEAEARAKVSHLSHLLSYLMCSTQLSPLTLP